MESNFQWKSNWPSNEWKESTFEWMKGVNPLMNEKNQPFNEWKELTLKWMKGINLWMKERN